MAKKNIGGDLDTFTYWLEAKLQDYGSIWGGSAFKFGIYSRNNNDDKQNKSGRTYTSEYAWYTKYGKTKDEAFERVRSLVVAVIEAVQNGELEAIDDIELGEVYKWKIAFHYQRDIHNPDIINIYDPSALRALSGLPKAARISECHKKLLADRGTLSATDYAELLWATYQKSLVPEIVDTDENRQKYLNTIYYGPPGTGKTYLVLRFLQQLDDIKETSNKKRTTKHVSNSSQFWHLAPGQGGYLWPQLKEGKRLGYEWCKNQYGDLKTAKIKNEHWSIITRFASVKKGDYFVVISGYKILGLAQAKNDYDYSKAISDDYDFQTIEVEWIEKFDTPILLNSTQTMTFCRLNGGSRWDALVSGMAERGIIIGDKDDTAGNKGDEIQVRRNHMLVTFHQSYSYEDFIQGIKPVMDDETEENQESVLRYTIDPGVFYRACDLACQKAGFDDLESALRSSKKERKQQFTNAKPFYLVIDEINRGNVANILGELITLMEVDKRLGAENEIIVDLPYSKKPFGVPSNLYIIGTMNTADRSVEALDSALRRRFSFVPLYPNPGVIEQPIGLAIDLSKVLLAINCRITQLLDRDHTIGHAYFTSIQEAADPLDALAEVFRTKVIPQLQEYFFNAPEKILQILGNSFVHKNKPEFFLFGRHDRDEMASWSIEVPPTDTEENRNRAIQAFISIYSSNDD